jgi:hypothetical protein
VRVFLEGEYVVSGSGGIVGFLKANPPDADGDNCLQRTCALGGGNKLRPATLQVNTLLMPKGGQGLVLLAGSTSW